MKKKISSSERKAYGIVKEAVANCLQSGMTAREAAEHIGTTPHTVYSVAKRLSINPRYVLSLKRKFPHGGLKKAIMEYHNSNMSTRDIAKKLEYDFSEVNRIIRNAKAKELKT